MVNPPRDFNPDLLADSFRRLYPGAKPWYQSRTIVASLVAAAICLGIAFGMPPATALLAVFANALAIYVRRQAMRQIRRRPKAI